MRLGSSRYPAAREMIDAGLGGRARDRFQSRLFAHAFDADGSFACFNSHEDDAG